jgi:hypothetical protein
MRTLCRSLVLLLAFVLSDSASGEERLKLFKDYWYGEPLDAIRQDSRTFTHENQTGERLLELKTTFLGAEVVLVFEPFADRDALESVIMYLPSDQGKFENFKEGLNKAFLPVIAASQEEIFDYVMRHGSTAVEDAALERRFEDAAFRAGDLKIMYVERSSLPDVDALRSADDVFTALEDRTRVAWLAATADKILLVFKLNGDQNKPKSVEDF